MSKNPYQSLELQSIEDFEFFAGLVVSRLSKSAKAGTREFCLKAIFNELKNLITQEQLSQIERNIRDLYGHRKQKELESHAPESKGKKKTEFIEGAAKGRKANSKLLLHRESSCSAESEDD